MAGFELKWVEVLISTKVTLFQISVKFFSLCRRAFFFQQATSKKLKMQTIAEVFFY